MTESRRRSVVSLVLVLVAAACSGGGSPPTTEPDPSASNGAVPSASTSPTATARAELVTLAPDGSWRTTLQLLSGPGGRVQGTFDVGARYRIRFDCLGDGGIVIRVANRARARRDCRRNEVSEPVVVRGLSGARLRVRVVADRGVDWVAQFEVPR